MAGRVVLEIGCGRGTRAVWLASQGAKVIAVDPSADNLVAARRLAERHEVAVEFHQSDLAELAFIRAERVDACFSVYALARSSELSRVFRQVHRVLRQDAPMVISLPHPTALQCRSEGGPPTLVRAANDPSPLRWEIAGDPRGGGQVVAHRASDVFGALRTSNFRVDTFLEPMAERLAPGEARSPYWCSMFDWVPSTLILRARKEGS